MFEWIRKIFTVTTNLILLALELSLQLILLAARAAILFLLAKYILIYFSLATAPAWLYYLASSFTLIATSYILMQNPGMLKIKENKTSALPVIGIIISFLISSLEALASLYSNLAKITTQSYKAKFIKIKNLAATILLTAAVCITLASSAYLLHLYCFPYLQIILPGLAPFAKLFGAYFAALAICSLSYKAATSIKQPLKIGALFLAGSIVAALYYYHLIPAAQLLFIAGSFPAIVCISCLALQAILSPFIKTNLEKAEAPTTPVKGHPTEENQIVVSTSAITKELKTDERTRTPSLGSSNAEGSTDGSNTDEDERWASPKSLEQNFEQSHEERIQELILPILAKQEDEHKKALSKLKKQSESRLIALEQQLTQLTQQQEQAELNNQEQQNRSKLEEIGTKLGNCQAELETMVKQQKESSSQEQTKQIEQKQKLITKMSEQTALLNQSILDIEEQKYNNSLAIITREAENDLNEFQKNTEAHISELTETPNKEEATQAIIAEAETQAEKMVLSFNNKKEQLIREHHHKIGGLIGENGYNTNKLAAIKWRKATAIITVKKFVSKLMEKVRNRRIEKCIIKLKEQKNATLISASSEPAAIPTLLSQNVTIRGGHQPIAPDALDKHVTVRIPLSTKDQNKAKDNTSDKRTQNTIPAPSQVQN